MSYLVEETRDSGTYYTRHIERGDAEAYAFRANREGANAILIWKLEAQLILEPTIVAARPQEGG